MSSKMKQWVALTTVGVLAVMVAGWFLLVSPKRSQASDIRATVAAQDNTNSGLQAELAMLKAQAKTLPQQQATLAKVAAKIPDNPALPALIRALSSAADDAGVELVSIAPGQPSPVAAAPAGATRLTAGGSAPAAGGTTPVTGGSAPAAGSPRTLGGASAGTSSFSAGVLTAIPLNLNVVGGYFQVEQFFDHVENLARATKVTEITMVPGTNPVKPQSAATDSVDSGKVLNATVTANVYMAVGRGIVPAGTVSAK